MSALARFGEQAVVFAAQYFDEFVVEQFADDYVAAQAKVVYLILGQCLVERCGAVSCRGSGHGYTPQFSYKLKSVQYLRYRRPIALR